MGTNFLVRQSLDWFLRFRSLGILFVGFTIISAYLTLLMSGAVFGLTNNTDASLSHLPELSRQLIVLATFSMTALFACMAAFHRMDQYGDKKEMPRVWYVCFTIGIVGFVGSLATVAAVS